jgi:EAL domain-containing protein (putative c-di-GMP-specific phosphodiesterase class I)
LKIDRAFVKELSGESDDATIVSAIVALAKTLNLKVVAEGVETEAQQAFLTELGCNMLQGYLLGKPVSAQAIEELSHSPDMMKNNL